VSSSSPPLTGVPLCSAMNPPCPPMSAPENLEATEDDSLAGWVFQPPPHGAPLVAAADGVRIAWFEDGSPGATGANAIYALLPAGGDIKADTPVWLVTFEGACLPLYGGALYKGVLPSCAPHNSEWNVIINAVTGDYIASFTLS
jgi:hypothetical protein